MKHIIGRIVLMGFLLLTLLVLQWDGTALLPGTGTRIVYAQETYSKTGSDEVYPKEGIPKQHGPVIVPQQELFSSEPEQGEETLVIESSSSDVRTSVLKAPAEGSNGSMTVKIKWLDYDGTEIASDSTSLPYRVALTLQKMTGNDADTARDVSAAEYGNDLTRNASRGSWTVSWSDLPYREGENYTVRVASSEDYEFVTEVQAWNLSGDTAIWDTNLVLQLKEPEEIKVTAELLCYPMKGKTLSSSDLPYSIPVTLYQDDGSGELTRAEDAEGNELDPVTFNRNSRYNSVTKSDEYYWRGVFNNVPNKEDITYVPKADELLAYFREDSNRVTGKTKADGIKIEVVYTFIQEYITIPVKVEWYLAASHYTWNNKVHKPAVTVKVNGKTLDKSQYNVAYIGGCKAIGTYNAVVTLKDSCSGSKTVRFTIGPKSTSLKSVVSAAKNSLTVKWKKQAAKMPKKRITGYQVQYCQRKDFKKGARTVTVKGVKNTSKKIGKLKSGKTYYVRVRTYMKSGQKTYYYSDWSAKRAVKVR